MRAGLSVRPRQSCGSAPTMLLAEARRGSANETAVRALDSPTTDAALTRLPGYGDRNGDVETCAALMARVELATVFGDEITPALAETAAELRQRCSEHYRLPDQD